MPAPAMTSTSQRSPFQSPPPSTQPSASKETPSRPKQVSGPQYRSGELEQGRLAVLQDLGGSIPQVPVEWLLDDLMPTVDINRTTVKARLMAQGHITNGRWSDFPLDPIASAVDEVKTFKPLVSVIQKIVQCTEMMNHGTETCLTFFDNPHRAPKSHRSNATRPDGYFVRPSNPNRPDDYQRPSQSTLPHHHWDDIALAAEYKKGDAVADKNDIETCRNASKILWSMHHIMRSDPCRRFTYGLTVENTEMRIWFACRSTVFVTTSFNFIKDHEKLIHFVLSSSCAKEQDLGWDPTIKRVYVNNAAQFDITVHDMQEGNPVPVVYRTTKVIADFGADPLRGRGTRVFEAYRWKDGAPAGAPVAIKDVWVDFDRDREGSIRQELERTATDEDKALVHQYFMTVLNHGDVIIDNHTDHTLNLILRGHEIPSHSRFLLDLKDSVTDHRESSIGATPPVPSLARAGNKHIQYPHKIHYRIVFKEVGTPVHAAPDLANFFNVLEDATVGLHYLHKNDWVHRDISSGNILLVNGGGRISDLEYARRSNMEGSHEIRTGTIDFMSLEVEAGSYLFRPSTVPGDSDTLIPRTPFPPFQYNPLHDLESLWWIAVWMMLYHRLSTPSRDKEERKEAETQLHAHRDLFPGSLLVSSRSLALTQAHVLREKLACLPEPCHRAALQLESSRVALTNRYIRAEAGSTIDSTAFTGVHQNFIDAFHKAQEMSVGLRISSLYSILQVGKRPRDEDGDEFPGHGEKDMLFMKKELINIKRIKNT